jgi:hypothetical protein
MPEVVDPTAPATATGRFYFRSNGIVGAGHRTQLCVRWPVTVANPTGLVTVIAESDVS